MLYKTIKRQCSRCGFPFEEREYYSVMIMPGHHLNQTATSELILHRKIKMAEKLKKSVCSVSDMQLTLYFCPLCGNFLAAEQE